MDGAIQIQREARVATLSLNDPPHNPIGLSTVDRLEELLPDLEADREVRAIVLRGAGERSFSAGANLKEQGGRVAGRRYADVLEQRLRVFGQLERLHTPVVAAIRGACLGGGLELALCCHFRVGAANARIGLPEVDLGIAPAWGGISRLARLIGRARALDLMLRGRHIDGREAERVGLLHAVCAPEELEGRARALAEELAAKPPLAIAAMLSALFEGEDRALEQALAQEGRWIHPLMRSRDAGEGVAAFLEKRPARFTGE